MVLNKLEKSNITLKLNKSKLITKQLQFLGFILSENGISTSPEKVEAIQNFPRPKNIRQLQSFLGVCNYYWKFQRNYSQLTTRFKHLLSSKHKWKWKEEDDETFICLLYTSFIIWRFTFLTLIMAHIGYCFNLVVTKFLCNVWDLNFVTLHNTLPPKEVYFSWISFSWNKLIVRVW